MFVNSRQITTLRDMVETLEGEELDFIEVTECAYDGNRYTYTDRRLYDIKEITEKYSDKMSEIISYLWADDGIYLEIYM